MDLLEETKSVIAAGNLPSEQMIFIGSRHTRRIKRGPLETTTGMLRVNLSVQQEEENLWYARVQGSGTILYSGRTRASAIRNALSGSSVKPHLKPCVEKS